MPDLKAKVLRLLSLIIILLGIPGGVYLIGKVTHLFGLAGGTPANLVIDASTSFDTTDVWRNIAQGGEEKTRMLSGVVGKLQVLKPQYIRLDHIYDSYDVVHKAGGQITFDWTRLDQTVDDVSASGARPFLSLSYMPPAISKSGDTTDLPSSWGDWEFVVQKTIEHFSGQKDKKLFDVYYEVWNEPDLFGNFKVYGSKNYLDLYLHSVAGAQRAQNTLPYKIGGPATTALYENWVTTFLKFVQDNHLRLDFYSWHRYSKDIAAYEDDAIDAKRFVTEFSASPALELAITESGPNSENDQVYDNSFGAIHAIATNAVLQDQIQRNFIFEVKDGPGSQKLWERWGILTNEKFGDPTPKPRYYAIDFLNKMTGKKINVAGAGSWVKAFARADAGSIKTLVVNYDSYGTHSEAVPLTFVNLPFKNFTFKRTDFFGRSIEGHTCRNHIFYLVDAGVV